MKKIILAIICCLYINISVAQDYEKVFVSNYLNLSISNYSNWRILQKLPFIEIITPEVKTFITINSETYDGNENIYDISNQSFESDKSTFQSIEKIKEDTLEIDGIKGVLYIAKTIKNIQIITFTFLKEKRKYTISNYSYLQDEIAETMVKKVINTIKFNISEPTKLIENEFKNFEDFKLKLHNAFQKSDEKDFGNLLMTQSLFIDLYNTKIEDETLKMHYVNLYTKKWDKITNGLEIGVKQIFNNWISEGKKMGIDWSKTELINMDYEISFYGVAFINVECNYIFSYNESPYVITVGGVMPLESGWYVFHTGNSDIIKL